jgi:hypothetical protein
MEKQNTQLTGHKTTNQGNYNDNKSINIKSKYSL